MMGKDLSGGQGVALLYRNCKRYLEKYCSYMRSLTSRTDAVLDLNLIITNGAALLLLITGQLTRPAVKFEF